MRRTPFIGAIIALVGMILYACGIIPNGRSSMVTITIGSDPYKAVLQAEAPTTWSRLKHLLAGIDLLSEAQAYIPSVVQAITVTVTAPDIAAPIVGVKTVSETDTSASVRIEVPNGIARNFLVEGYRGVDGKVYYSGSATVDLTGTDVTLPVAMSFAGPGIWVSPSGNDTTGTGTPANPFQSIDRALSASTGTDAIVVTAGTYTPTIGAGPPTLQLQTGTALICAASGHSTIIDFSATFASTAIWGAPGASVDNCRIVVGQSGKGVDDRQGGTTIASAGTRINGVLIELPYNISPTTMIGADLYSDSPVLESTITGTGGVPPGAVGVRFNSGMPAIRASMVTSVGTGLSIVGPASPEVTGNSIDHNSTGILISVDSTADPQIHFNVIFCNNFTGADVTSINAVSMENNSWNRDANTIPAGPRVDTGNCLAGADICPRSVPEPVYIPFSPAAANGCP